MDEGIRGLPPRIQRAISIGVILIFFFGALRGRGQSFHPQDPLRHEFIWMATGRDSVLILPHRFLLLGSVRMWCDGFPYASERYRVDTQQGKLFFTRPPDSGLVFTVLYRALPVTLGPVYHRFEEMPTETEHPDTTGRSIVPLSRPSPSSWWGEEEGLRKSGSLFRGITVGTGQGMRFESGLRLQVAGRIAPDVEVVATLTDQSTPIQPEGNTQTLQEIDKVFIDVMAPHVKATFGDFVYASTGSSFGTYTRKLQGASVMLETAQARVGLMGAATKGTFTTRHFQGEEGKQGPYQLTGDDGRQDILVLAGTERVYVDGEPMTRGEDNDYVIDYGLGQITFTRNRLITAESRITVDYEYSDQEFQKAVYGGQVESRLLGSRIRLAGTFLHLADDQNHPLSLSLDDTDKATLRRAGDDADSAVVSGAKWVGEGHGDYLRDPDDPRRFVYVGEGKGAYRVRFSYVGYGKGDYAFRGYGIYHYEGPGRGSYLPVRRLPMPRLHQMATFRTDFHPSEGMAISLEAALSNQDMNRFSLFGDRDNVGSATELGLSITPRKLRMGGRHFGAYGLEARWRRVGEWFRPVGRTTDIEHGRKWGFPEGKTWGETTQEVRFSYEPVLPWRIGGEWGRYEGAGVSSDRWMFESRLDRRWLRSDYRIEQILTASKPGRPSRWVRQKGAFAVDVWRMTPTVRYEGEDREASEMDSSGVRYDTWAGGIGYRSGPIGLLIEEENRKNRRYGSVGLSTDSHTRTRRARADVGWGSSFSVSLALTRRQRTFADPVQPPQRTDLADARLRMGLFDEALTGGLQAQLSSTQVSEMVRDTIRVGRGLGTYRYDPILQELVPDPDGDLLLRLIQTGRFFSVRDFKAGLDLEARPPSGWSHRRTLRALSAWRLRSQWRLEVQSRGDDWGSLVSPPWGEPRLVSGRVFHLHELESLSRDGRRNLRLFFTQDASEDRRMIDEGRHRTRDEGGLRLRVRPLEPFGLMAESVWRVDRIRYEGIRPDRDLSLTSLTFEVACRPLRPMEIALTTRLRRGYDRAPDPDIRVSAFSLAPWGTYALYGRGQIRAELEIGRVTTEPKTRALPYELLSGDQPGWTIRWSVLVLYRLSGHMQATLSWRGRDEPWREKPYQTGQVEMRAFF